MADKERQLKEILDQAKKEIAKSKTSADLENFKDSFLGRKAQLSQILRSIKDLPEALKPVIGRFGNQVRLEIEELIKQAQVKLGGGLEEGAEIDLTLPGEKISQGHLHPLTLFLRKVEDVFLKMGFEIAQGPEVELIKYNFDLLNIPKDHPSRDVWDTFYVKAPKGTKGGQGLLLRTHTSPVQIRAMEKRKPPIRLIAPGRVFRHEATDAGHETTFYQCEGLVIDKDIKITDLIGTLKLFLRHLFGKEVKMRVRPHFYPFTEPSMDVDISCILCQGQGCPVCQRSGWLEMLGSGMVHPRVLKNMGIDPKTYTGFAFGLGIDRFMMLYFGINDIRLSYQGDLRFLKQF